MYFIRDSFYSECLECDLRGIRDYYSIDPDGDRITMEALIALCSPVETEEARIKRFHGESDQSDTFGIPHICNATEESVIPPLRP